MLSTNTDPPERACADFTTIFIHVVIPASGTTTAVRALCGCSCMCYIMGARPVCLWVCVRVNFHKTRGAMLTSAKLIFTLASLGFEVAPSKHRCVLAHHADST